MVLVVYSSRVFDRGSATGGGGYENNRPIVLENNMLLFSIVILVIFLDLKNQDVQNLSDALPARLYCLLYSYFKYF